MDEHLHQQLSLADYLSPVPIYLDGVGFIRRPQLIDLAKIRFPNYNMFIKMISISLEEFVNAVGLINYWDSLSDEEKNNINIFDLIIKDSEIIQIYLQIFNFFIMGEIVYDGNQKIFWVLKQIDVDAEEKIEIVPEKIIGKIDRNNYYSLCKLILATNYVKTSIEDISKIKSKKAKAILEKIEKEKSKIKNNSSDDKNYNLGNIISKVSANSNGINPINVWQLTIYQLYNEFHEITFRKVSDMKSMNHAFAGGEFDLMEWIKSLE